MKGQRNEGLETVGLICRLRRRKQNKGRPDLLQSQCGRDSMVALDLRPNFVAVACRVLTTIIAVNRVVANTGRTRSFENSAPPPGVSEAMTGRLELKQRSSIESFALWEKGYLNHGQSFEI